MTHDQQCEEKTRSWSGCRCAARAEPAKWRGPEIMPALPGTYRQGYAAGFAAAKAMAVAEHMETVNRIAAMKMPKEGE